MAQPTDSTQSPSTTPHTTPYTLPPVTTPPPNTSVLGKHVRGSETSSETGDKGEDGGVAYSRAFGLRTDFDIPKQASLSVCAQQIRLYNPCKQMAEQNGHVQLRPSRTPAALGRLYNSAIRDGIVQTTRCNHTRTVFVCLLVTTTQYYTTPIIVHHKVHNTEYYTTVLPMMYYIQSIIQQYEPVAPVAQR